MDTAAALKEFEAMDMENHKNELPVKRNLDSMGDNSISSENIVNSPKSKEETSDALKSNFLTSISASPSDILWCLAPMVRVGNLSFRALCLYYGADLVWTEELIAQRLARCTRKVNDRLGTIDFITPRHGKHRNSHPHHNNLDGASEDHAGDADDEENNYTVVLRLDPRIETERLIVQLGASTATYALAAARVVCDDAFGIDINMGCPKRFSVQGGMGAALLQDPNRAQDIIRTLATNLPGVRVSAKIRLLESVEATAAFMRGLEAAGAKGITVHLRHRDTREWQDADWSSIEAITNAVSIPVFLNGDFYLPGSIQGMASKHPKMAGVMLARPALMNPSIFRCKAAPNESLPTKISDKNHEITSGSNGSPLDSTGTTLSSSSPHTEAFLPLRDTVVEYVRLSLRYETPYQLVKYTVMEMMNTGRHTRSILPKLHDAGIDFGRLSAFEAVQSARSLKEIAGIFGLDINPPIPNLGTSSTVDRVCDGSEIRKDIILVPSHTALLDASIREAGAASRELHSSSETGHDAKRRKLE